MSGDCSSEVEMFVRGLLDYCKHSPLRVRSVHTGVRNVTDFKVSWNWILHSGTFLNAIEEIMFDFEPGSKSDALTFVLPRLVHLKSLQVQFRDDVSLSWEWVNALTSLSKLTSLRISSMMQTCPPQPDPICFLTESSLMTLELDLDLASSVFDVRTTTSDFVAAILKSVLKSKQINKLILSNVSRETMADVRNILLHCHSLNDLQLRKTRLGYDGILYICSALRQNTSLESIAFHDVSESAEEVLEERNQTLFHFAVSVPLPQKTTSTDFLLELNNSLEENSTLKMVQFDSTLCRPLQLDCREGVSVWSRITCLGLSPLQFNASRIKSGIPPDLRRSYSSSDLRQSQLHWECNPIHKDIAQTEQQPLSSRHAEIMQTIFNGGNRVSRPCSAPDADNIILQSFSNLDPRLIEQLKTSHTTHVTSTNIKCKGIRTCTVTKTSRFSGI